MPKDEKTQAGPAKGGTATKGGEATSPLPASIVPPASPGAPRASEQEKQRASGAEQERLDSLEGRGATEDPEGDIMPDYPEAPSMGQGPQGGLQDKDATFVPSGTFPQNMIPSPTGPIPVSTVARTRKEAQQIMEERNARVEREQKRGTAFEELSDEQIDQLDGPTLRAVAQTRGYQGFPPNGTRTAREHFKQAQRKDDRFGGKGK